MVVKFHCHLSFQGFLQPATRPATPMNFTTKHVMPGLGVGCGWLCFALGSTCLGFRLDVLPILRERWRWFVACVVVAGKMHRKIQAFFIFTPIWGNDPVWLIFFKWVEITNQYMFLIYKTLEVVLFHNFVEWDCLVAVYMSLTHFHFSLVLGRGYTQNVASHKRSMKHGVWDDSMNLIGTNEGYRHIFLFLLDTA